MTEPTKQKVDHDISDFEDALLRSIDEAKRGEFAAVHTPEKIEAKLRACNIPLRIPNV